MENNKYKIMIVEDDEVIANELVKHLGKWGYEIRRAVDFSSVINEFVQFEPHLVLMDISLPFFNGYHWCAMIRNISKIPIIFMSSLSDNMNIVMAINMGGDDFVTKPFDLDVLSAKITAMLRRTYSFAQDKGTISEYGGIVLNISGAYITVNGERVDLTKNEFRILELLFENKENVVSRENIMKRLWDSDCFIDDNTLTVNMTRLKKKLEEAGIKDIIRTKKGIGYMLIKG